MNEAYIRNVIEAALLAAGKPLQLPELAQLFEESVRPKPEEIRAALDALASEYASRGIEVKETASGFRIQVRREIASEVSRLWPERPAKYSRALLETLALIAYRQPITRAEIEAVRGVAVNPNILKTVIERNWVRVVGHRDVPGRPELLGTTRDFLDYFGLRSLDELPPLAELKAMGDINLQLDLSNPAASNTDGAGAEPADGVAPATENGAPAESTSAVDGGVAEAAVVSESAAVAETLAPLGVEDDDTRPGEGTTAEGAQNSTRAAGEEGALTSGVAESPETVVHAAGTDGSTQALAGAEAVEGCVDAVAHAGDFGGRLDSRPPGGAPEVGSERIPEVASGGAPDIDSAATDETSDGSTDAIGDDDDSEDDELSADGDDSHEMVAGPPGLDG